jgi:hypothetical protein
MALQSTSEIENPLFPDDDDEIEGAETPAPATKPKNKGGRPRTRVEPPLTPGQIKKREKAAAAAAADAPADEIDFWEWFGAFTTDQWQYLIVYLWRVEPITNRRTGGRDSHIQKYSYHVDQDKIMTEHGSGIYRFDVCRINPEGTGSKRIKQHFFTIQNPNYPPKIPLGDWIDDPSNSFWNGMFKKRMLELETAEKNANLPPPASLNDPNAMFNTMLHALQTLRGDKDDNGGLAGQLVTMLTASQAAVFAANDPTKQLQLLQSLLGSLQPQKPAGADPLMEFLRDELKANRQETALLRQQVLELSRPRNIFEELEQIGPVIEKVSGYFGYRKNGAKSGPENEVVGLVDKVVDKIGDNLPMFLSFLEKRADLERMKVAQQNGQQPTAAAPPGWQPIPKTPAAAPNATAPPPAAAPTATEMPPGMTAEQMEQVNKERELLNQLGEKFGPELIGCAPFMVDHFRRKLSGYDLRDWYIDANGTVRWNILRDEIGPERLTALVVTQPALAPVMKPVDDVLGFFQEFFTPVGQEPDEEDEPEPLVPAAEEVTVG